MDKALFEYLLRLGDDSLVLAQRLCEWSSRAPTLEVDLSLSNLGLDLVGQAQLLLGYAGEVEGQGRDEDRLAYHRDAEEYRNCLLVEQPNGDFAQTMARHFLFSIYRELLLDELVGSSDTRLAEIAAKAVKETRYHAELASDWVIRLGDGTEESHRRMQDGLDWFWRFVDEMFAVDEVERVLIERGIAVDPAVTREAFDARVTQVVKSATLEVKPSTWPQTGGRQGNHTEHLSTMLAEMQVLPRRYPEATW
ncbi:1,2-phenylacetyl-CoA epoxidase subunit PaaC [Aurantiacibacter sediminis]|uniref:Phenylacetate-CoA oxygenase subunit PaaC n=1 Tax=Aurantiacibacter sediminis TaxID=2793064 RepID=A0ABS0N6R1_9SPHN|nr:1,2-phenylacetyl-CoA epoxidase subunit PaaC [Aurantiacibacter sediminis]MBH5323446.1 phenylacetate-CoA oxygenase subunit PaaC [Aurantiacibacter sediminis]